jgi:hypothetical protein
VHGGGHEITTVCQILSLPCFKRPGSTFPHIGPRLGTERLFSPDAFRLAGKHVMDSCPSLTSEGNVVGGQWCQMDIAADPERQVADRESLFISHKVSPPKKAIHMLSQVTDAPVTPNPFHFATLPPALLGTLVFLLEG